GYRELRLLTLRRPPDPPPFPYTTLFRSRRGRPRPRRDRLRQAPRPCRLGDFREELRQRFQRRGDRRRQARPPRLSRPADARRGRSEEHTSELQSLAYLVCRLLLEKKKQQ